MKIWRPMRRKKYRRMIRQHIKNLIQCGFPEKAAVWKQRIRNW